MTERMPEPPASEPDEAAGGGLDEPGQWHVVADSGVGPSEETALPGEHRGGFRREMTAPVPIAQTETTAPSEDPEEQAVDLRWAPAPQALPRSAPWALTFAIMGLGVSLLVGWGFLIGIVGATLAIVALRRPWESRGVATWALCLSVASLLYSAGWLWWASTQGPLFG